MTAILGLFNRTQAAALHYYPSENGRSVYTADGRVKFNRALYGAHTGFRVDCSDFPEFGIYLPNMGGNLKFYLPEGSCTAIYTPGKMEYNQGGIEMEVQVGRTSDMAIWRLKNVSGKPHTISFRYGGASGKRFSREGDLGVDKPDCFDFKDENCKDNIYNIKDLKKGVVEVEFGTKTRYQATLLVGNAKISLTDLPSLEGTISLNPGQTTYMAYIPGLSGVLYSRLPKLFQQAEKERNDLASTVRLSGDDKWINPVGGALAIAGDAIWSGEAWLHGSIGWRTPHLGWRGAYTGSAIGRHDRSKTHLLNYAANQIDTIPAVYSHPQMDSALNLARARKAWGTPMYSNGYICRRPGHKNEMSHYDMNLVYIDAMLRHFRHTGDTATMRQLFPTLKRHLDWEKLNFDPDGDGLYDAYCCIWASDALYYNGGQVTHSSAYNAFANRLAAEVARRIGENPAPFEKEAQKITQAIDSVLWISEKGHWAEFKDEMGLKRLHENPAVWTIYHAIDSEIADPFKAYSATCYIDREIPHIPIGEIDGDTLFTLSTTNWKPYSWSINNVAIAEVMHTALAYWQAGRPEEAYLLMKSVAYDNMLSGASPLNFGQISQYDAARGECYRDFADPIGVWSRALTEGLYGIRPDLLSSRPHLTIEPGFPRSWDKAEVDLLDISYTFSKSNGKSKYHIINRYPGTPETFLIVNSRGLNNVILNGQPAHWEKVENSIGFPRISITIPEGMENASVELEYSSEGNATTTGNVRKEGLVLFEEMTDGNMTWYEAKLQPTPAMDFLFGDFSKDGVEECIEIDLSEYYNAEVSDIFKNEYLSPRPQTTTLQIPKQGIGEWCHPTLTAEIDDSGLRQTIGKNDGIFMTEAGVPFKMNSRGKNVIYTSLWDNYPDSVTIYSSGRGSHLYLAMAGSTNHMQWGLPNGMIRVEYKDGSHSDFMLTNPISWAPIEQDFFTDSYAFSQPEGLPLPLRFSLADGSQSRRIGDLKGIEGVEPRRIPGGAGILLDLPIEEAKELKAIVMKTLSSDVVIGLMGATLGK